MLLRTIIYIYNLLTSNIFFNCSYDVIVISEGDFRYYIHMMLASKTMFHTVDPESDRCGAPNCSDSFFCSAKMISDNCFSKYTFLGRAYSLQILDSADPLHVIKGFIHKETYQNGWWLTVLMRSQTASSGNHPWRKLYCLLKNLPSESLTLSIRRLISIQSAIFR